MTSIAPHLTFFVVTFVVLDVLAALALVGAATGLATRFFGRHRAIRTTRRESLLPYYGHLALHH